MRSLKGKGLIIAMVVSLLSTSLVGVSCAMTIDETIAIQDQYQVGEQPKIIATYGKDNVDEIKDLLPPSLYQKIKDWGWEINVIETIPYTPPKRLVEATEKYRGTCKIGPKDDLLNYKAGVPFPEPKIGLECIYNYERRYMGDSRFYYMRMLIVDKRGNVREVDNSCFELQWKGRIDEPPLPVIPENPMNLHQTIVNEIYNPESLRGMNTLLYWYEDPDKDNDNWIYVPVMRRVRRFSGGLMTDNYDGTDILYEDGWSFQGKIPSFTYKLIGKKDMYVMRHQRTLPKQVGIKFEGLLVEKSPVYIVEQRPKDPNHPYSKRVMYIDPDTWVNHLSENYDRKGQLWRAYHMNFSYSEHPTHPHYVGNHVLDFQRSHATAVLTTRFTIGIEDLRPNFFTLYTLLRRAR